MDVSHSDMCRYYGTQHDRDNHKLVLSNMDDLYEQALKGDLSESSRALNQPDLDL